MPLSVAAAVLLAALFHAGWNALLRRRGSVQIASVAADEQGERLRMVTLMTACSALIALPGAVWLGPPAPDAWPWLATSVLLHVGYNVFLAMAYDHGELGQIYPLARGAAPLVTLIAGAALFDERPAAVQSVGVAVLASGILVLVLEGGRRRLRVGSRGAAYALVTSLFIAAYTLADGFGARAGGDAHAYVCWLFVLDGLPLLVVGLSRTPRRLVRSASVGWRTASIAGALSLVAYWIAIWAMTLAPIAAVAALRESSVLFAVLIGVFFLGERLSGLRVLSALGVLCGLVLLRLG